jgi:hypothetical protein
MLAHEIIKFQFFTIAAIFMHLALLMSNKFCLSKEMYPKAPILNKK